MPVDYSKWDALELSDDSDVEVHPNVDKRSFIRAKQNQIHQQRFERKHRIATLRYEKTINDGLLARIDALLNSLESHKNDAQGRDQAEEVDEVVFDALMEVNEDGSLGPDVPTGAPEGVHVKEGTQPSYSKMMGALVDQVKSEVDKASGGARFETYVTEVGAHKTKVQGLQSDLMKELTRLEKEDGAKITSESIHTGFNTSHVSKGTTPSGGSAATVKTGGGGGPELLNPLHPPHSSDLAGETSGSAADVEEGSISAAPGEDMGDDEDEEAEMQASPAAKRFAKIKFGDYKASLQYISANPAILTEKESDGLLAEAFNTQLSAAGAAAHNGGGAGTTSSSQAKAKSDAEYARQCVEKALLLQYCRQLGRDGVQLFFKRITTPEHQARKMFLDDVHSTYARIRSRTAEIAQERESAGGEESGDREQIQLHAVDPGTKINIVTPRALEQCETDEERASRRIFESFPPGLRKALESGSLDKVNVVLGKMSVDEAEAVVEQLGDGGMLSLEQGVIDATTDEGKRQVEEIERTRKMPGAVEDDGQMSDHPRVQEVLDGDDQPSFADEVD